MRLLAVPIFIVQYTIYCLNYWLKYKSTSTKYNILQDIIKLVNNILSKILTITYSSFFVTT